MTIFPKDSTSVRQTYPVIAPGKCLAKSLNGGLGCDVSTHLKLTCLFMRALRSIWSHTRKSDLLPPVAEWGAAFHDIGKMTPAFQDKIYRAINLAGELGWKNPVYETPAGHAQNSAIILEDYFGGKYGKFAKLVGGHHGELTWLPGYGNCIAKEELGGEAWQKQRRKLLDELIADLDLPRCDLAAIPDDKFFPILGGIILADWLSSSMELTATDNVPDETCIKHVIEKAGLMPVKLKPNRGFQEIFGFQPNAMQRECLRYVEPGGIYVVESGMGSGKTEAALGLAYKLIEQGKADGLYFALPTQLTSEKIHRRLNLFLEKVVDGEQLQSLLIHGSSYLQWELPEATENTAAPRLGSWFQTQKRALLAPYAVGTLDQALLAKLRVRHNSLRAFALAGKVVIFDEIHSYDAYTGSLLASLIGDLRAWGCTVILLSATLTSEACRKFAQLESAPQTDAYPRLIVNNHGRTSEIAIQAEKSHEVKLEFSSDESTAMAEAVQHAKRGEQVLWIENTVGGSRHIFQGVKCFAPDVEVGLIHSRFPMCVRNKQEAYWVDLLGKNGQAERVRRGRILVATQVLEQSVDVDADFMITRLAPADFLFQRIGRLWRHADLTASRPSGAERKCLVLVPDFIGNAEKVEAERRKFAPYNAYWLYRTWETMHGKIKVSVPDEIRPVLEEVYREREESGKPLLALKQGVTRENDDLTRLANIASAELGNWKEDDEVVATRLGENQVDLLLLHNGNRGNELAKVLSPWFGDEPIELPPPSAPRRVCVETARKLLPLMLKVPERLAPRWEDFSAAFLSHILWVGEKNRRPVRLAYVNRDGQLLTGAGNPVQRGGYVFYYDNLLGYAERRNDDEVF